ncbi:hypothetical protein D6914_23105, partial [Escherichia coli]|nr:hypothetical protein [Escherichia coli]MJY16755.1 hypothetical protein [Escherichia coli]
LSEHKTLSISWSHYRIAFWLYQRYSKILNTILIRLVLICNSVIFFRPVIQKNAKNGYHSIKNT